MKKTEKRINELIFHLELGTSIEGACSKAGIGVNTYYRWKREDDEFKEQVEIAIFRSEATWVYNLNEIALNPETPAHVRVNALKFLLSRRHPKTWASTKVIEVEDDSSMDIFQTMIEQTNEGGVCDG